MSKFQVGDTIIWHGDANVGDWPRIREGRIPGAILEVLPRTARTVYRVKFEGIRPNKTVQESNISLAPSGEFKPGDRVRGKAAYGPCDEFTGTVAEPAYYLAPNRVLRVLTDPGFPLVASPGGLVHMDIESATLIEKENDMTETTTPALIGPKPEVQTPKFVTPFERVDTEVRDGNGKTLAEIEAPGTTYAEDRELAEIIKEALNAKYAPTTTVAEPRVFNPNQGRILYDTTNLPTARLIDSGNAFAFEVAPNKFWYAESLETALRDSGDGRLGWPPRSYHRDIRTGKPVTETPLF